MSTNSLQASLLGVNNEENKLKPQAKLWLTTDSANKELKAEGEMQKLFKTGIKTEKNFRCLPITYMTSAFQVAQQFWLN